MNRSVSINKGTGLLCVTERVLDKGSTNKDVIKRVLGLEDLFKNS